MSGSGITPTDACMSAYVQIKTKRSCRWVEMKITEDSKAIEAGDQGARDLGWSDFVAQLPKDACRWYLYDYEWTNSDGAKKDKLLFVHWAPDNCKVKEKMLAASSKEALRSKMEGVVEVQGTDLSDMAEDQVKAKVCK
eukprot:TRINITY_DN84744_c0_g1_i1.p1 TRINITY_DN84744_c0_g1~~TRINITY_DN84744_c0_g1_i1.p1  ORF type:complete len:148 (-),score=29.95 TRINITY_DN84744_c0_g1_i1:152-565(-)